MTNVKLSQIASGGAFVAATDNIVTVRGGTTDLLTTLPTATSSIKGVVQPDNTTITIVDGVISVIESASPVISVFTRTGAVTAQSGDYSIGQISGAATVASTGSYSDLINTPTLGTAAAENLSSVIIDNGAGALTVGATQVTNDMLAGAIAAGKITLANADIIVGSAGNVGAAVAMSGDAAMANTGAITVSKTNGIIFATSATVNPLEYTFSGV